MEKASVARISSFLFAPNPKADYGYVVLRIIVAFLLLDGDIPRWYGLANGHPEINGVARALFPSAPLEVTYIVTFLETLMAISLLFGFMTRLGGLWGAIEFAITGAYGFVVGAATGNPPCKVMGLPNLCTHITGSFGLLKDLAIWAGSVALLIGGSKVLSLDGWIAKRRGMTKQ